MASFQHAIAGLLKREGGLVDRADDRGGITNFGISIRAFPDLGREGIRNLTAEHASRLYRAEYWDTLRLSDLESEAIATLILDFAVHSGNRRATIEAQRLAGVKDDGRLGPITLAALNAADSPLFVVKYLFSRLRFFLLLAERKSNRPNFRGWVSRLALLDNELRARRLG